MPRIRRCSGYEEDQEGLSAGDLLPMSRILFYFSRFKPRHPKPKKKNDDDASFGCNSYEKLQQSYLFSPCATPIWQRPFFLAPFRDSLVLFLRIPLGGFFFSFVMVQNSTNPAPWLWHTNESPMWALCQISLPPPLAMQYHSRRARGRFAHVGKKKAERRGVSIFFHRWTLIPG